ncbi:MAG: helix-turn-helix domain-containing protein [Pirellulaceae bacterium]|jgi:DNA-binding MarR family transcriptional regulator|nr:helix-turn-helix domain-containing protein [Pirellulaceae bacterium]MDP7019986.1 helix-turn-helix domain-containing protein [Pirellulaceae bacterium]
MSNPLEVASRWTHIAQLTTACSRNLRRWLAEQGDPELGEMEILLLFLCAEAAGDRGGFSQVELASALGVSPAQTSSLVERLRQSGLLLGTRSQVDRRRQVWRASREGEHRLHKILSRLAGLNDWSERVSAERLSGFIDALELLMNDRSFRSEPPRLLRFPSPGDTTPSTSSSREAS